MGGVAWGVGLLTTTVFIWLAVADTPPPRGLQETFEAVNARVEYEYYQKWDWRYIPPTTVGKGNCAVHAYTYWRDLHAQGIPSVIKYCKLSSGVGHVYVKAGDWVLDNREPAVVKRGDKCN